MNKYCFSSLALAASLSMGIGAAQAATTIDVQTYSFADWQFLTANAIAVETFETPANLTGTFEDGSAVSDATDATNSGELEAGGSLGTSVGTFTTLGGTGTGTTCQALSFSGGNCQNIALQHDPDPLNGQGNIVPDAGNWAINTADTKGLEWMINSVTDLGGALFNQLVFATRDPADVQLKTLTITLDDAHQTSKTFSGSLFGNNNEQLFVISFGSLVGGATIKLETSQNDAFTFDGAAAVSTVPLPAAGWLLLAGVGGLAAIKRRKKADA